MGLNEDGAWRWETGVARGKANPLYPPIDGKPYGWESGVARGKANPLYSIQEDETENDGILVYHGSNTNFNTFLTDFIGGESATDQEGPGVYFTTSREDAEHYGKYIYTIKLRPNRILSDNPKDTVSRKDMEKLIKMAEDWEMHAYDWDENLRIGLKMSVDAVMSEETPKDVITQVWFEYYRYQPVKYAKNAVSLGYDGISVNRDEGVIHYIIYNPQIISIVNKENKEETGEAENLDESSNQNVSFPSEEFSNATGIKVYNDWNIPGDRIALNHMIRELNPNKQVVYPTKKQRINHLENLWRAFAERNPEVKDLPRSENELLDKWNIMYGMVSKFNFDDIAQFIYEPGTAKDSKFDERKKNIVSILGVRMNWVPSDKTLDYVESEMKKRFINEDYEYHDDDYLKGQDIYDYEPTQAEIKDFLANKYQWKNWVDLSKEADRVAKLEKAQVKKEKEPKKTPKAFLYRLSSQVDYGDLPLMKWKLQQIENKSPLEAKMHKVVIDKNSLKEEVVKTISKKDLLETSLPTGQGLETGLYNKTLMEDQPVDETVDQDFYEKNPDFYVSRNKGRLGQENKEKDEYDKSQKQMLTRFSHVDINDIDLKRNDHNVWEYIFEELSVHIITAGDDPHIFFFSNSPFKELTYKLIQRLIDLTNLDYYWFIGVDADIVNNVFKNIPMFSIYFYESKRYPKNLFLTNDKNILIEKVKEIKESPDGKILYFNNQTPNKEITQYDAIMKSRIKNKLKDISYEDITIKNIGNNTYNPVFKNEQLNDLVHIYQLIRDPFILLEADFFNRIHNNGIDESLRGIGLGYKIYKAFIKYIGFITSDTYTTHLGINLYYSLLKDPDILHIVHKKRGEESIALIWKDYEHIDKVVDHYKSAIISNPDNFDIDDRLKKYLE